MEAFFREFKLYQCFYSTLHKENMVKKIFRLTLPLLGLIIALAGCDQRRMPFETGADQGPSLAGAGVGLERAMEVQDKYTPGLMALADVVGTATGLGPDARPAILVFTTVAGVKGIPGSLEGVLVIPKVTGEFFALLKPSKPDKGKKPPGGGGGGGESVDPKIRFGRPVPIGVSTGHPDITAGTIGARVTDGTNVYALSNNHVYADQNEASIGDAVIQPGTSDGGSSPTDDIGTLSAFEPIVFGGESNLIDAAIAASITGQLNNATPSDGYGTPKSETVKARINQKVQKYGRTTGLTKGRVFALNATLDINYGSGRVATFVDQIIITPGSFSAGGDSGSLIVSNEKGSNKRMPVGLLFAGSSSFTVANHIDAVLEAFGVTIDGE